VRLHDVANVFNNMLCTDAYTDEELFSGQLGLYDDNKRDSETAERRILSLSPDAVIPARRTVAAIGTRFIIGHGNPDDFRGSAIRVGYVVHEAGYLSQVRTLAQVCLGQDGFTAYTGRAWVKDLAYSEQSSTKTPEFHIHFAVGEAVDIDMIVSYEGRLNIVRSLNYGSGGTIVASCEQMAEPAIEVGTVTVGTYDPIQDTRTGTPVAATIVRMRWQALFAYRESLAPKFGPGDIQFALAKSVATPMPGDSVMLSDGTWLIESLLSEGNVWLCRGVRGRATSIPMAAAASAAVAGAGAL
jgi:hypothetical protein